MDFVRRWSERTEIGVGRFIHWLGVTASKFYDWRQRYGCVNEHNGWVPQDFWLELWEKEAIIDFHPKNPLEGYRRLTFMMLDHEASRSIFVPGRVGVTYDACCTGLPLARGACRPASPVSGVHVPCLTDSPRWPGFGERECQGRSSWSSKARRRLRSTSPVRSFTKHY
jgi:hypothetical protein